MPQVLQSRKRAAKRLTELRLKGGSFKGCRGGKRGRSASAALSRRAIRRLRGSASGRFRTSGRNSSATVRGTIWEVTDRCDGTLTKVGAAGSVCATSAGYRTVVVRAGHSYLGAIRSFAVLAISNIRQRLGYERPMKLIIQIPCFNEEATLPATLADLPRTQRASTPSRGSSSTMGRPTAPSRSRASRVDHLLRLTNTGPGAGFPAGLDAG